MAFYGQKLAPAGVDRVEAGAVEVMGPAAGSEEES